MRPRSSLKDDELRKLGTSCHGVVTASRARAADVSKADLRTRVRGGFLSRPAHGCYVVNEQRDELTAAAVVQARHPRAALAGRSAAQFYGLDGFDRPDPGPDPPDHVSTAGPRRPVANLMTFSFTEADVVWHLGVRILRPLPVVASLREWVDLDETEAALECLLRKEFATEHQIRVWLEDHDKDAGATLRAVMDRRGWGVAPTESYLETLAIQRVFRPQGFTVTRQVVVTGEAGEFIGRVDFELDGMLLVEVNGLAFHSGPDAVQRDSWRALSLRLAGRDVEQITWRDVTRRPDITGRRLRARCQQLGQVEHTFAKLGT